MSEQLSYGLFMGNLCEFVDWWNKQSALEYNGATRIIHIKEFEPTDHTPMPTVEYILQDIR